MRNFVAKQISIATRHNIANGTSPDSTTPLAIGYSDVYKLEGTSVNEKK